MVYRSALCMLPLLAIFSQGFAQQLPFNVQVATAKTASLVNSLVDSESLDSLTGLVISNAMTPSIFNLDGNGQLSDSNGNIASRGVQRKNHLSGIFFQDGPRPLDCTISSVNGPLQCHQGKFSRFVACPATGGAFDLFLAMPGTQLPSKCEVVTLKTSTAG